MEVKIKSRFKILDFDCECRPLSWYSQDWVTKEVTAIAWKWIGDDSPVEIVVLGEATLYEMFAAFLEAYNEAGLVTGHYIRGFDLPVLNGALTEIGMDPLSSKLTQDTKLDLIKRQGLSGSQENLASMLNIKSPKISMTQADWRAANRLLPEGIKLVKERAIGDVVQHIEMREALLASNMLGPPKIWNPVGGGSTKYFA